MIGIRELMPVDILLVGMYRRICIVENKMAKQISKKFFASARVIE